MCAFTLRCSLYLARYHFSENSKFLIIQAPSGIKKAIGVCVFFRNLVAHQIPENEKYTVRMCSFSVEGFPCVQVKGSSSFSFRHAAAHPYIRRQE